MRLYLVGKEAPALGNDISTCLKFNTMYIMLSSLAEKSKKPSQAIPHPLQVMMNAFVQA